MRRLPTVLILSALALPVVTMLPTVQAPMARPKPVRAALSTLPLGGIDPQALAAGDDGRVAASAAAGAQRATRRSPTRRGSRASLGSQRLRALSAQRHTASFESVGVSWNLPAHGATQQVTVLVRTHSAGGWSDWQSLDADEGGAAGDPTARGAQRAGTQPLWVGPSDGVQVRVDSLTGPTPTGLKLELIDPGSSAYDAQVGTQPPGTAAAAAGQPKIYSRAAWGADESKVKAGPTYMSTVQAGVLHHTTDTNNYSAAQVPRMIRADYAYHLSLGWNDIGYNFLVDRFGRIWEGRAGGVTRAVMGAHAGGFNTNTFGVAAIGNYETASPTSAMLTAIERLFAWKLDLNHRDPLGTTVLTAGAYSAARWREGTAVRLPVVMGHRDVDYTACPGAHLYPALRTIRSAVARYMQAAITNPVLAPTTAAMGAAGTNISGATLTAQTYTMTVTDCTGRTVASRSGRTTGRAGIKVGWNAKVGSTPARPGPYDLRIDSSSGLGPARPWSGTYTITPPAPAAAPTGSASTGDGSYVPVTPARVLDTRSGSVLPLGPGGRVDLPVLGRGGVPATGVAAVVLSLSSLCPSSSADLVVWPTGTTRPATSNLDLPARGQRAVTVVVPVGAGGAVSIGGSAGVSNLVADVVGYTATSGASHFLPVTTAMVYDSRSTVGRLAGGGSVSVPLPTLGGVPAAQVSAVVAQVTVLGPSGDGYLWTPRGSATSSVVNYRRSVNDVALAVLPVTGGRIAPIGNSGASVYLRVDVVGVWTSDARATQLLTAVPATRVARIPLTAGHPRNVRVTGGSTGVPADASAVLVSLTAAEGGTATAFTAYPAGSAHPPRGDLRVGVADPHSNLALVPVGSGGAITMWIESGGRWVSVDVVGYTR